MKGSKRSHTGGCQVRPLTQLGPVTSGARVEELGLDFGELPGLDPAPVTSASKADFVRRKVRHVPL